MNDKDTKVLDGQDAPTPRTGLRASNTLESMRPREVNLPLQGRGLPPIDFEVGVDFVQDVKNLRATVSFPTPELEHFVQKTDLSTGNGQPEKLNNENFNVLPVDWPTAADTMGFEEVERAYEVLQLPLTDRVLKLEERVDSILDRLAAHNVRSSHKI